MSNKADCIGYWSTDQPASQTARTLGRFIELALSFPKVIYPARQEEYENHPPSHDDCFRSIQRA